jgi:peptidoglycan hydrolase-like protein with peptidoglycan-binding domain
VQTLLDQLKALQIQIQAAQQQQRSVIGQLMTTLNQGSKGENVMLLQQLLSQDPSIYPEGTVSGFYGKLTAAAVKRFQKKHGIEQAGNVGPKTLKKLNELFGKYGTSTSGTNGTSTPGWGKHDDDKDDDKDDDDRPCDTNNGKHLGWFIGHGNKDKDHDCKGNGGQGTTTPPVTDTTAPVISAVTSGSVATTTATITWTTNENATGKVYFGTVNPLVLASATANSTATLSTAHSFVLTGLSASSTYYYVVESKDAANNTATSSQGTFTTTN